MHALSSGSSPHTLTLTLTLTLTAVPLPHRMQPHSDSVRSERSCAHSRTTPSSEILSQ